MRAFLLFVLLLWFLLGYFLCKKYICNHTDSATKAAGVPLIDDNSECSSKLYLLDKETDFNDVSEENFQFLNSSDAYLALSDDFTYFLADLVDYLGSEADRRIQIKGFYLGSETNSTSYEDLGLARANNVKTYFLEEGVNPEQLTTFSKLGSLECFESDTLKKGIAIAFGPRVQ